MEQNLPITAWSQNPAVVRRGNVYECYIYGEMTTVLPGPENVHVSGFDVRLYEQGAAVPAWTGVTVPMGLMVRFDIENYPVSEALVDLAAIFSIRNNRTYVVEARAKDTTGAVDPTPISATFTTPLPIFAARVGRPA